ncbi:unnamed protein product, partial [Effrenium voratum]
SLGCPMDEKHVDKHLETVPLTVVTDAKDVYEKGCSDTPSYGAQKSLAFTAGFVKQTNKKVTKLKAGDSTVVVGRPLDAQDEIFNRLLMLGERPGKPRFDPTVYFMRSAYARFDEPSGHSEWRELERDVDTKTLQNAQ